MSLIGSSILAGSAANQGYTIEKSLQFNGTDEYLSRTFTAGSRTTWTWSGWVKASSVSGNRCLFCAETNQTGSGTYGVIRFVSGSIEFFDYTNGTFNAYAYTESLHRDPSAWYHIVVAVDTTSPASENRVKIYANGVEVDKIDYTTFPIGYNGQFNNALTHQIGTALVASQYFDGYLADVHFIDGQALDPTYFGVTSDNYSQWVPKKYAGTYGTNGFFLNFKGTYYEDKSGNGNDWTANNLASTDVVNDTPNNNFCTWNPLAGTGSGVTGYGWTLTDGGLDFTATNAATYSNTITSTFAVTSGKWYLEVTIGSSPAGGHPIIGVIETEDISLATSTSNFQTATYISTVRATDGQKSVFGSTSVAAYGSSLAAGDILNIAIDGDNGKIWWGKNGTWFNSGAPESGTNAGDTFTAGRSLSAICIAYNANGTHTLNAGQKSFAYTPPTGFNTLCTDNLPEPTVTPGEHFSTLLYAGNGTTSRSITGVGFQPDLVWGKERSRTGHHTLVDSVRGLVTGGRLSSNRTNVEDNFSSATLSSFDSDGFTTGSSANLFNTDDTTFVTWNWKAGGSVVTNTDGTISSNTSVNTSAGFSIISYTGSGSAATIGHGLGAAPEMIILRRRDGVSSWRVAHAGMGTMGSYMAYLQLTNAASSTAIWNSTAPTSSVFSIGTDPDVNSSGGNHIAYCFRSIENFSKFGSYTGNGSTDGPFVYTGFRPAFLMIKRSDSASSTYGWRIFDTQRSPQNPVESLFAADSDVAEIASSQVPDILANGFKYRSSDPSGNASGGTFIYMAFAENPFKYANARGTSFDKFTTPSDSALTIPQSARFDGSSSYLSHTPSSAGNRKTWTLSLWVKKGKLTTDDYFFTVGNASAFEFIKLNNSSGDSFEYAYWNGSSYSYQIRSSLTLRDPSAWYHIVVRVDTTQATAADRVRLYVNGTKATSFSVTSYPSQNTDTQINSATATRIGSAFGSNYFDGYLAEINHVDGQSLGPESFGYQDTTTKQWLPRSYNDFGPEIDYGANGFRLDFQSGALGTDRSGNNNDWTLSNMSSTNDVVLDSPSNNFCTLNPLTLTVGGGATATSGSLSEGSLKWIGTGGNDNVFGTIAVSSGKWYYEIEIVANPNTLVAGWSTTDELADSTQLALVYYNSAGIRTGNKTIVWDTDVTTGLTFSNGDIIGFALDIDGGDLKVYQNNSLISTITLPTDKGDQWIPACGDSSSTDASFIVNFGQDSSFAGAQTRQSNQDGNGIGDFYYTPPTGFLALCTDNLPSPTIANGRDYFNTVLYAGNGTTGNAITGVGFQPDFSWLKGRSTTGVHGLWDAVRGATKYLVSNNTDAETTDTTNGLQTFESDGFTLGSVGTWNTSSASYVSWNWKANGSGVSNTVGTIDSTVSVNTTAGFSIAAYTSDGASTQTFGHGLGVTPSFVIIKARDRAGERWPVWHQSLATNGYIALNETTAASTGSTIFQTAGITSSVIAIGNNASVGLSGTSYICYAFAEVEGFSKFGSYTGNGAGDGPFIYTGFTPALVIVKRTNDTNQWTMVDTARSPQNVNDNILYANLNNAEVADETIDFDLLSNGFKLRSGSAGNVNTSGSSYIYMAFAENPFKNASAR